MNLRQVQGLYALCKDQGQILIAAHSVVLLNISSSLEAEGMAVKHGMSLAKTLNLDKAVFETDSSLVAESLFHGWPLQSTQFASWHRSCTEELSNHKNWSISLIRREANSLADIAAKHARDSGLSWQELDACPIFLSPFVQPVG